MAWKDATSYSRDDKERIPRSWEYVANGVRVWISTGHVNLPGSWAMHCRDVGLDTYELADASVSTSEAQRAALSLVARKLQDRAKRYEQAAAEILASFSEGM